MIESWEAAFPMRLAFGLAFFAALALWEAWRHGLASARLREYAFLLGAVAAAVAYAVLHDQLTVTISPEYFLAGKGLVADPRPLRVAVALLALRASYSVGLVLGTALLVANNPSSRRRQLGYAALSRLALLPLAAAVAGAALGGVAFPVLAPGLRPVAVAAAGWDGAGRFLAVQGIHAGSYVGAFAGGVAAVVLVVARRRAARR